MIKEKQKRIKKQKKQGLSTKLSQKKPSKPDVGHTPELEDLICDHVAQGGILDKILGQPGFPDYSTWCDWVNQSEFKNKYPGLSEKYARAKVLRIEHLIEKMLGHIHDDSNDILHTDRGPMINHAVIQRQRLQVDTIKFIAAKLKPHIYGDKVDVNINANFKYVISAAPLSEQEFIDQYTTGTIDVDESGNT